MAFCAAACWATDRCTAACLAAAAAAGAREGMLFAPALQATVPRIASPIAPPTCWPVFSSDDATPVSLLATLASATSERGTQVRPMPSAVTSLGASRQEAELLFSVIGDSQNIPPVA